LFYVILLRVLGINAFHHIAVAVYGDAFFESEPGSQPDITAVGSAWGRP